MMGRLLFSLIAGLIAAALMLALAETALPTLWPAYAEAAPTKDYSLAMLLVRLTTGAGIVVVAAYLATTTDTGNYQSGWILGALFLAISIPIHVIEWPDFPVWYHVLYLGYLVPLGALGGWLASRRLRQASLPAKSKQN